MKKISLLLHHQDRESLTDSLGELGVVHLIMSQLESQPAAEGQLESKSKLQKAIKTLQSLNPDDKTLITAPTEQKDWETTVDMVLKDQAHLEKLAQEAELLQKEVEKAAKLGDFDLEKVKKLEVKGVFIRFYQAAKKAYETHDFGELIHEKVQETGKLVYFLCVSGTDEHSLPFDPVPLPKMRLSELNQKLKDIDAEKEQITAHLSSLLPQTPLLEEKIAEIDEALEFEAVKQNFRKLGNGQLMSMEGWFPAEQEMDINQALKEEPLVFFTHDPEPGDEVPVKLKNSAYVRLFEPITRIFQLPNYHELDLTPIVAVFYPIFFAYCLGDAGYGLLVLAASLVASFTFLKKSLQLAFLGIVLGTLTTLMGIVKSGSVFGIPLTGASSIEWLNQLSAYILIPDDQDFLFNAFNVALMIGVVQILTGITASIVKKFTYHMWKEALPQIGRLLIVVSVLIIFMAGMGGIDLFVPWEPYAQIALFAGLGMVLLFHNMSLTLFKRIGSGLLPIFFIFTGILGDVLSYVRLFALGVASSVLGLVVNQIGMQIFESGWWGVIVAVLFLVFGHGLNLALAILGAFVHPLRLTFVEFYNNAQFEGGGLDYRPFKKMNHPKI